MRLTHINNLHGIVAERLRVPSDNDANASGKVATIVAGIVASADSIDDLDVVRHGGMPLLFDGCTHFRAGGNPRARSAMVLSANCRPRRGGSRRLAFRTPPLPDAGKVTFIDVDSLLRWEYGKQKKTRRRGSATPRSAATRCCCVDRIPSWPRSAPGRSTGVTQLRAGNAGSARSAASLVPVSVPGQPLMA